MEKARVTSVSKNETAIRSAMANVYFLAKEDLPTSLLGTLNAHMLHQVNFFYVPFVALCWILQQYLFWMKYVILEDICFIYQQISD